MIEVRNLTQTYPGGKGVFDLDFTIQEGEVFGYLGPNGAGKTTTIRNLLGFTNPSSGTASVLGIDCRRHPEQIQSLIGYLPGEIAFFDHMTGNRFLTFIEALRKRGPHTSPGLRWKAFRNDPENARHSIQKPLFSAKVKALSRKEELLDRLELDPDRSIRRMSKGMKQKLAIVTAFMHDPPVYILDEPTSGLDPFMQNVCLELVEEEKARGKTIMFSSHIFEEVQRVCDRAGIIREGRLVAVEDIVALDAMKRKRWIVTLADERNVSLLLQSVLTTELRSPLQVEVKIGEQYRDLFGILSRLEVTGFFPLEQSLEDVFMKYYGEEGRQE